MTMDYDGQCTCGSVKVTIELPEQIEHFVPRACDCDFCTSRSIKYLSHPDAVLFIESSTPLEIQKQGSNQADFLTCRHCHDVIAASIDLKGVKIGSLNATILNDYTSLKTAEIASPKLLSREEKIQRWKSVWLSIIMK